ncbi:hypothetical protein [Nocardia transvalensis]|uniref:hypothetical protein n=1 Tax=Nocardia transvalensis TaxID=37333 RepID=UPI001894EB5F|nr:hypothetical protein [Nocardia transvalensis]MBF6333240.1 hypothetical protein [Nocardia transvalensis]
MSPIGWIVDRMAVMPRKGRRAYLRRLARECSRIDPRHREWWWPQVNRQKTLARPGERLDGTQWRSEPVEATELAALIRRVIAACFLTITYLSGVRTGEALNLRHGCISRDSKLGLIFMSGEQLKSGDHRRERSPETIPWVVTEHTEHAVSILQRLTPGPLLFPSGELWSQDWFLRAASKTCTPSTINTEITAFIDWFNTDVAAAIGHPIITADPAGKILAPRLRRTLAWHIVRRPGGTIAGATQYGHTHDQLILGYAGRADSGFVDELAFEQFLARAEAIHDDHQRLSLGGEHVSGPAADEYRRRVAAGSKYAGLAITTKAQVAHALSNPDLQVHHGPLLTCVYRPATAACRASEDADSGPSWRRCRMTCTNIARTDRDISELRNHVRSLRAELGIPGLPEPLQQRIQQRLQVHERAITDHESERPNTKTEL